MNKRALGYLAKKHGQQFESVVKQACEHYRRQGIADIEKLNEPVKQLGGMDTKGHFKACYEKKSSVDFGGNLRTGQGVYFECKCTSKDRLLKSAVGEHQAEYMERKEHMGCMVFVLANIQGKTFAVPWNVWRDMKQHFGVLYITTETANRYEVNAGTFLDCLKWK